jgi:hypothetical protein
MSEPLHVVVIMFVVKTVVMRIQVGANDTT